MSVKGCRYAPGVSKEEVESKECGKEVGAKSADKESKKTKSEERGMPVEPGRNTLRW